MKPISSAITGMANQAQKAGNSTGSERGGTGYAARPPRSYGLDHEPTEAPPPVVRTPRASLPTSVYLTPSPLPELRQVLGLPDREGSRTYATVLAKRSDLPALRFSIEAMRAELTPAEPTEIAADLARLFSHYPQQQGGNAMTAAQDWLEDMGEVSAKAFKEAVRRWRRGPNVFKPSPGQLLTLIAEIEAPLRARLDTALEIEAREASMTPRERLGHLHQRQYEVEELHFVPHEIHIQGDDARLLYLREERALVRSEIEKLEQGE